MKNFFNTVLGLTYDPNTSIAEDKKKTVNLVIYFSNILGASALLLAAVESYQWGSLFEAFLYLLLFVPFLFSLLFINRLSSEVKSYVIIISGSIIATLVMYNEAIYGAAQLIYLTMVIMATFLLGIRHGLALLGISLLIIVSYSILFTNKMILINDNILTSYQDWISWIAALVTFIFLGVVLSVVFHRMNKKLEQSLDIAEKQSQEVRQSNRELETIKNNLEQLVKVRTVEIEQKNNELINNNEELERFNILFVGREHRIKELRDRVKHLESLLQKYEHDDQNFAQRSE
ncbi:MAG TPA: hypothetical protein P5514_05200 [Bacteroidales bacterium]|nr:hypothetical protein [Bacteroidales bacterium]HRX96320.1 hypothetical protein [Bacteroidales bacterium]